MFRLPVLFGLVMLFAALLVGAGATQDKKDKDDKKEKKTAREMILGEGNPKNPESKARVDLVVNAKYPPNAPLSTVPLVMRRRTCSGARAPAWARCRSWLFVRVMSTANRPMLPFPRQFIVPSSGKSGLLRHCIVERSEGSVNLKH